MSERIITERDIELFNYIADMNLVTSQESLKKFFPSNESLKKRIGLLISSEFLKRLNTRTFQNNTNISFLTLTEKSKRAISFREIAQQIDDDYLFHNLEINRVRTKIENELPNIFWINENNLAKSFPPPIPDGAFVINRLMFGVEVERTAKCHERYNNKFLKYETHRYYEKILYFICDNNQEIEFLIERKLFFNEKIGITNDNIFPNVKFKDSIITLKEFINPQSEIHYARN